MSGAMVAVRAAVTIALLAWLVYGLVWSYRTNKHGGRR